MLKLFPDEHSAQTIITKVIMILVIVAIPVGVYFYCRPANQANEQVVVQGPVRPCIINLGEGRYTEYVEKDGNTYARIAIPNDLLLDPNEITSMRGIDYDIARGHLASHDERPWWAKERVEQENGYRVYVFRLMTEDEVRAAVRTGKPLIGGAHE